MKQHGIGVGYQFPHDFEGDDVQQQYLPDELVDRRYYVPNDQGHEVAIAARMAEREAGRAGKPGGRTGPAPPMASMRDALKPERGEPEEARRDPEEGRGRLAPLSAGESSPQLTDFFTSSPIFFSSAAVSFVSAQDVGHMVPSSRLASSLKPNVA